MTAAPLPPCPDCGAPLTGQPTCATCGLRLVGPDAVRLWEVDQALAGLDVRRTELTLERRRLLAVLRADASTSGPAASATPAPPAPDWTSPRPAAVAREWTPQRVQNSLLGLGGLLLTVAGIVFAAVTYDRLGAGGRAAVLLLLTGLAAGAVPLLVRRGLAATAETVSAVALALAALDAYGLRTLGLADDVRGITYAAGSAAALAVVAGLFAAAVPVRLPRYAAVVLAQLPVPLLLARAGADSGTTGLVLALLAAANLAVVAAAGRIPQDVLRRDLVRATATCGSVAAALALLTAGAGAFADSTRTAAALALLVLAVLAAAAGLLLPAAGRVVAHAAPAPLVAFAASALGHDLTTDVKLPVVVAAVGLIAVQVAALLPRSFRDGPVAGALVVTGVGLLTQAEAVVQALVLPLTWLAEPWTLRPGSDARSALSPTDAWDGTVVTSIVLGAAAVAVVGGGLALHRLRTALLPAAALVVLSAVVLPLGVDATFPLALVLLLAIAVALLTAGTVLTQRDVALACLGAGAVIALLTAVWSTADRETTVVVLAAVALAFAGVGIRRPEAVGAAGITGGSWLAAAGAARGLEAEQVGGLLLVAPAALVAATFVLDPARRLAAEVAAALLATTAVVLAVGDVGWLSWTLAGAALLALADALHPDRRAVAAAGALLLSASSWVRLADAGVTAPEPYVVPLALVALAFGHLRARRNPGTRSFAAYGPGLTALLVPSLLASFDDASLTRPLLVGGAALAVLLVGARERLQAPVLVGGLVLAVDALQLLAPYAAALPRWSTLGAAGLLLVAVGATYEQRRRDVDRLRDRFDALT